MRLHLLAGCRGLLRPDPLDPGLAAGLIGARVRAATAFWLDRTAGLAYHDFLRDAPEPRTLEVFALSLRDNFGARHEPLVVLPDLLEPDANAAAGGPALVAGLFAHAAPARLVLHALALPAAADPEGAWAAASRLDAAGTVARLAALEAACIGHGLPAAALETALIETTPELPAFAALWRNAVAAPLAQAMQPRLAAAGLALEPGAASAALGRLLAAWGRAGIAPAFGLSARDLDRIAEQALPALLATAEGPDA